MDNHTRTLLSKYFTKLYGMVRTPIGDIPMGDLMDAYLSEEEKEQYIEGFSHPGTLEAMTNEDGVDEEMATYEEFTPISHLTYEEIVEITNRMEGYW